MLAPTSAGVHTFKNIKNQLREPDGSIRLVTAQGTPLKPNGRLESHLQLGNSNNRARVQFPTDSMRTIISVSRLEDAGYDVCFGKAYGHREPDHRQPHRGHSTGRTSVAILAQVRIV